MLCGIVGDFINKIAGKLLNWFWEFLYSIAASIFRLVDGVMACANKICGIDTISVNSEETDFLSYILGSNEIDLAFKIAGIVGFAIIVIFCVIAIIRTVIKTKPEESVGTIVSRACKNMLIVLFIPVMMYLLIIASGELFKVIYSATTGGSNDGIGRFLAGVFSYDGLKPGVSTDFYLAESFDYTDAGKMWNYCDLSDYNYFFAYVGGIIVLWYIAKTMILFVERAFSIAVLYICAPFSVSVSLLDGGESFKMWREQILVKFLTGYGGLLAINIFAIVLSLIARPNVVFFPDSGFLNMLLKFAFVVGGAFSLERVMGAIGNVISRGAGDEEMYFANNSGFEKWNPLGLSKDIIEQAYNSKRASLINKIAGTDK